MEVEQSERVVNNVAVIFLTQFYSQVPIESITELINNVTLDFLTQLHFPVLDRVDHSFDKERKVRFLNAVIFPSPCLSRIQCQ